MTKDKIKWYTFFSLFGYKLGIIEKAQRNKSLIAVVISDDPHTTTKDYWEN